MHSILCERKMLASQYDFSLCRSLRRTYSLTFSQRAQAALPRIQELNPRVKVRSDGGLSELLMKDQTYYAPFDCVIACDHDFMTLSMINTAARFASRPFYAAGIHGFYGYVFADLVGHEFAVERDKSNVATAVAPETLTRSVLSVTSKKENNGKNIEMVKKQEIYCPLILANSSPLPTDVLSNRRKMKSVPALLPCLRALFDFQRENGRLPGHNSQDLAQFTALATTKSRELQLPPETLRADFLRSFIQNIGAEIVPTAAFIGGRLSEDVINVLGKREQPIQNFALFDGDALEGRIYCLYSPPPELAMAAQLDGMGSMTNDLTLGMTQMPVMTQDMSMANGAGMMPMGVPMDNSAGALPSMGMNDDVGAMPLLATNNGAGENVATNDILAEPPTIAPANTADVQQLDVA